MAEITQEQLNRMLFAHRHYLDNKVGVPMNIGGMDVSSLDFSGSQLWGANMVGIYADGAKFDKCNMWYVKAEQSVFTNCSFYGAKMCYGDFCFCDFTGADLTHINPYLGYFHKAKMDKTVYEGQDFEKIKREWERAIDARESRNKDNKQKKIISFGR